MRERSLLERLADMASVIQGNPGNLMLEAANQIQRQHAENQALREKIENLERAGMQAAKLSDQDVQDEDLSDQAVLAFAAESIRGLRFIQAASVTALGLDGKSYREAKDRMNQLATIQERLEVMARRTDLESVPDASKTTMRKMKP